MKLTIAFLIYVFICLTLGYFGYTKASMCTAIMFPLVVFGWILSAEEIKIDKRK